MDLNFNKSLLHNFNQMVAFTSFHSGFTNNAYLILVSEYILNEWRSILYNLLLNMVTWN